MDVATVVAAQRHHPLDHSGEEQHLAHGQSTTTSPHQEAPGWQAEPSSRHWRQRSSKGCREEGAEAPSRPSQSGLSSRGELDWGDEGDERWRSRQISTVRRERARRRSECPTRRRRRPPELAGIERRSRQRLTVARGSERLGLGSKRVREGGNIADWAGLVRSNPLGLT
jgi:hypothetical protein